MGANGSGKPLTMHRPCQHSRHHHRMITDAGQTMKRADKRPHVRMVVKLKGGLILTRNEPLASIIQDALESYASGRFASQAEVMRFLEMQPAVPKMRNGKVSNERVKQILTNPLYAGIVFVPSWKLSPRLGLSTGVEKVASQGLARRSTDPIDRSWPKEEHSPLFERPESGSEIRPRYDGADARLLKLKGRHVGTLAMVGDRHV